MASKRKRLTPEVIKSIVESTDSQAKTAERLGVSETAVSYHKAKARSAAKSQAKAKRGKKPTANGARYQQLDLGAMVAAAHPPKRNVIVLIGSPDEVRAIVQGVL